MDADGYKTRQKDCILQFLKEHSDTAYSLDELFSMIEQSGSSVGKTTVYRYVQKLTQQGQIRKFLEPGEKCAKFQYIGQHNRCDEHLHLKCTSCGKFIHLDCELMNSVNDHILSHHGFFVDNSKSLLFGLCESCMKKEAKSHGTD